MTVVNSVNPYRIEGQKTGAFEIVDVLGDAPDVHCIPVGNAGNITAYWRGYLEFKEAGRSTRLPRMLGFQAAGAAPIVEGHPIEHPETVATAIRIGNPASWYGATAAASESGGGIAAVTDEEILEAYRFLAAEESVFCEPASAASVAGLLHVRAARGLGPDATVVCVLTGHGLKDPDIAISQISRADGGRRRPRRRPRRARSEALTPGSVGDRPRRPGGGDGVGCCRSCPAHLYCWCAPSLPQLCPFGPAGGTSWFDILRRGQPVSGVGGSRRREPISRPTLPTL